MAEETKDQGSLFKTDPVWPTFKRVPLDELPPDEAMISEPPPASFVESVRQSGVRVPIILEDVAGVSPKPPESSDKYRVWAGRRRIKAARKVEEMDLIVAQIYPAGSVDGSLTIIENAHRSDNAGADFAAIMRLAEEHQLSPKEIGQRLGLHLNKVNRLLRLADLHQDLLDAFLAGVIAETTAFELAKLPSKVQGGLLKELKEDGSLTVTRVREARQVKVQKELQSLEDDMFETPDAPEGDSPEVAWPVEVDGSKAGGPESLAGFVDAPRELRVTDADGETWVFPVAIGFDTPYQS